MVNYSETPVCFSSGTSRLFGILTKPTQSSERAAGCVLIAAGVLYRTGPHRLYVKMARTLAGKGHWVLRFDPHGIGDSDGDISDDYLNNIYRGIEKGRFIEDTLSAARILCDFSETKRIFLGGLCGGAITAFLAGPLDTKVSGVFGIGTNFTLHPNQGEMALHSQAFAGAVISGYIRRVGCLDAWKNLLNGNTDFELLMESAKSKFAGVLERLTQKNREIPEKLNRKLLVSIDDCLRKNKKILFIWGERDIYLREYQKEYESYCRQVLGRRAESCGRHIIPQADHSLSNEQWTTETSLRLAQWFEEK